MSKVRVDVGQVAKFSVKRGKLCVRTRDVIKEGQEFHLSVRYGGTPRAISDGSGDMGWEELTDGVLVAGQTNGAPSWFPCNDRPSNKASYRISVTTASPYYVVANGALTSRRQGAGRTTWVYEQPEPMATYLATVQIGRYVARDVPDSPVPMSAVLPEGRLEGFDAGFGRQAEMMEFFVDRFGPYPFGSYTVVITDDVPSRSRSRHRACRSSGPTSSPTTGSRCGSWPTSCPTSGSATASPPRPGVTSGCTRVRLLRRVVVVGGVGWPVGAERASDHWKKLEAKPQDLLLGDPGPDTMFDDRVYKRGALLLHALRAELGDADFFDLLRQWADRYAHGSVTTAMFVEVAEEVAGRPLGDLFSSWLEETELPPLPS